jgi:UDP-N-acetyl-2-amino-2-deoxyglucuronate dehydrogenase
MSVPEKKIKFAVLGFGRMGNRHAEMIQQHPSCELAAIIDVNRKTTTNFPSVPFFTSLSELNASGLNVDVINITTPNGLHARHALEALDLDKHIVIEKPMALKRTDAEKVVERAAEKDRQVFVVMQNRYSPVSKWLREMVASGKLGKIYIVQVNCFWNRDKYYYEQSEWHGKVEMDGGALFTQFSHFIDLLFWLFGDIKNIHSKILNYNHHYLSGFEDTGIINFDFIDGGSGNLNFTNSVWGKSMESSVTIIAEHGSIKVTGQYMDKVEYCHIKNYDRCEMDDFFARESDGRPNHYYMIDEVANTIRQKKEKTIGNADAIKVVDIIERIYKENKNHNK